MKKQTAVEWLEECIKIGLTYEQEVSFEGLFQQALDMEKEQIENSYKRGKRHKKPLKDSNPINKFKSK